MALGPHLQLIYLSRPILPTSWCLSGILSLAIMVIRSPADLTCCVRACLGLGALPSILSLAYEPPIPSSNGNSVWRWRRSDIVHYHSQTSTHNFAPPMSTTLLENTISSCANPLDYPLPTLASLWRMHDLAITTFLPWFLAHVAIGVASDQKRKLPATHLEGKELKQRLSFDSSFFTPQRSFSALLLKRHSYTQIFWVTT